MHLYLNWDTWAALFPLLCVCVLCSLGYGCVCVCVHVGMTVGVFCAA